MVNFEKKNLIIIIIASYWENWKVQKVLWSKVWWFQEWEKEIKNGEKLMDKGVKKTKRAVQPKIWKERNGDKRIEWRTKKW